MSKDIIDELSSSQYKYGFHSDIDSDTFPKGLSEDVIRAISARKEEPEWMTEYRLRAYRHWLTMHEPTWAHLKYERPDFDGISYYSAPKNAPKYNSLDEVDPELLRTFDRHLSLIHI